MFMQLMFTRMEDAKWLSLSILESRWDVAEIDKLNRALDALGFPLGSVCREVADALALAHWRWESDQLDAYYECLHAEE